jgi:sterol desaturase/sphingolipid hydroxylase (fatty acid hydroxylase superfamily)
VGKLGRRYQEWLGAPCLASEPLRMFDNAFMEAASKTPWWTVPLLWLPLALYSLWSALVWHAAPPGAAAAHAAAGLLAWALVEYALHRFVFHAKPTSYWGITLHFSFHGCHHKHPSDRLRLVFPPLFAAPLVAGFRAAIAAALAGEPGLAAAFFAGMLSGYVAYDCMHYFSHHAASPPRWMARSRKAHLEHHFVDSTRGFGVSGDLFDRVFGTLPRRGA